MPTLAKKNDCTGCAACFNTCPHSAITMMKDCEGYLNPVVDYNKCVECKLCERSCPIITPLKINQYAESKAYAFWSNPDRTISSSGGAFSAFARLIITKGGIVFGAAFDEHLHLRHIQVDNVADLDKLRGSKYVQSNINDTYRKIKTYLRQNRYVLFCGTPCQVAGLRGYLHKDYNKLLLLDLACHGVPSDAVWQSYLSKLSEKHGGKSIEDYGFRRLNGWGFQPFALIDEKYRRVYGIDNLYMEAFDKSGLFRLCCYHCHYANPHRTGDCSLADFWGLGRQGVPFKHDVMKGVSLVLVNDDKGAEAFAELTDCFIERRSLKEALAQNANLNHASPYNKNRDRIISAFLNPSMTLVDIDKAYHLVNHSFKGKIKELATRLNLFEPVKRLYNFIMANKHLFTTRIKCHHGDGLNGGGGSTFLGFIPSPLFRATY